MQKPGEVTGNPLCNYNDPEHARKVQEIAMQPISPEMEEAREKIVRALAHTD